MKELSTLQNLIYEIRGQKVMLDSDLARLYDVKVMRLNEAVKRNVKRFPTDFMFQLTDIEWKNLKSQFAISSFEGEGENLKSQIVISSPEGQWGGRRKPPFVFTEHGVAMLSSVLHSDRAIEVNIAIMRVFTRMREVVAREISQLNEMKELRNMLLLHIDNTDRKLGEHGKRIQQIIEVLNNLIEKPPVKKQIGFNVG